MRDWRLAGLSSALAFPLDLGARPLCPMNRSMPGLPVHHQLPEFTQTHVHQVSDAMQPSHPLSSPSPPAPNPSQQKSRWYFPGIPRQGLWWRLRLLRLLRLLLLRLRLLLLLLLLIVGCGSLGIIISAGCCGSAVIRVGRLRLAYTGLYLFWH